MRYPVFPLVLFYFRKHFIYNYFAYLSPFLLVFSRDFVLTQLYPYLQPGDIILFDEFNVPLHEFKAFNEFTKAFYIELKPLGAVNNYLQVAFVVK